MPRDDYEERREIRIERLEERADKARAESEARLNRAKGMADCIPFGQPILVGHHSEGRDRRFRAKIENNFRKGFELHDKAKRLESRAESAKVNDAISSDDPQALKKIDSKLAGMIAERDAYKETNRKLRKAKLPTKGFSEQMLIDAGVPEEHRKELISLANVGCLYGDHVAIPGYRITNLSANIRRVEQREQHLEREFERAEAGESKETEYAACKVIENVEENRVQLIFPGKPDDATRTLLKSRGFRWSPMAGAWQRHLANGEYVAHQLAKQLSEGK